MNKQIDFGFYNYCKRESGQGSNDILQRTVVRRQPVGEVRLDEAIKQGRRVGISIGRR